MLVELHGVYVPSRAGQPGARPLLSRLGAAAEFPVLRRADHVIAQARAMRDRIVEGGVDAERVTVLYPGLRTAEFSDPTTIPAEIPGLPAGRPVAMYVGSTHAYQGLDLLAAAQRRLGHTFSFVLVLSRDAGEPGGRRRPVRLRPGVHGGPPPGRPGPACRPCSPPPRCSSTPAPTARTT